MDSITSQLISLKERCVKHQEKLIEESQSLQRKSRILSVINGLSDITSLSLIADVAFDGQTIPGYVAVIVQGVNMFITQLPVFLPYQKRLGEKKTICLNFASVITEIDSFIVSKHCSEEDYNRLNSFANKLFIDEISENKV